MPLLTNCTPFAASHRAIFDQNSRQLSVVTVSATFQAKSRGPTMDVADAQLPVPETDVHHGDPASSSVRYEGEVAWHKPRVDVIVNACAYAPPGRRVTELEATLQLGHLHKTLLVCGDREWKASPVGRRAGSPQPFDRMPLVYERAFGGSAGEGQGADLRNLVGVGFRGTRAVAPDVLTELPNITYPGESQDGPSGTIRPAGFGVISRGWQPRQGHAGTYDAAWLASRAPMLPADFDLQHFQCAPLDQQSTELRGGERGRVVNMTPDGEWVFDLPRLLFPVRLRYRDRIEETPFTMDTVLIEPDDRRVVLLGRATVLHQRNRAPLEEIIIGDVSPGWLLARRRRKPYWGSNPKAGGGPKRNVAL